MDFKIKSEYEALLPKLPKEEYEALKTSIQAEGLHFPITVNSEGIVLDGHHRLQICRELRIEPRYEVKQFVNPLLEKKFVIEANLLRRQLKDFQIVELGIILEEVESGLAKQREIEAGKLGRDIQLGVGSNEHTPEFEGKVRDIVAQKVGLSSTTYGRGKYIAEKASEEIKEFLREGKENYTIGGVYNKLKHEEKIGRLKEESKTLTPPTGKFRTIVIDPPWEVSKIIREVRPNQQKELDYPTWTIDQIKSLPVKDLAFEDGCHIYLWTTHKFLPVAFEIFIYWGVKYECLLTWIKNVGFTPFSWMYSTEHVLFGRIGSLELLEKGRRLDFTAKVREHSRKPSEFYDLVKLVSPEPRIDLFSREKRDGFQQWGNEVDKFNAIL